IRGFARDGLHACREPIVGPSVPEFDFPSDPNSVVKPIRAHSARAYTQSFSSRGGALVELTTPPRYAFPFEHDTRDWRSPAKSIEIVPYHGAQLFTKNGATEFVQ